MSRVKICRVPVCKKQVKYSGRYCTGHYEWRRLHKIEPTHKIGSMTEHIDAVERPTLAVLAWAAGFYEGEGYPRTRKRNNGVSIDGAVIAQVNKEPLERLLHYWGGKIFSGHRKDKPHVHQWCAFGNRGRTFLSDIYPLLSERRRNQLKGIEL